MKMVKKRVAELEGAQLDWAVAKALGWQVDENRVPSYELHKEWELCGPIIERERIGVNYSYSSVYGAGYWVCMVPRGEYADTCTGQTPLIAAMRAFVASKLGDEVEVPE